MKVTNDELFKQALLEGLNRHYDKILKESDDEIVPSEKHNKIMQEILNGTYKEKQ